MQSASFLFLKQNRNFLYVLLLCLLLLCPSKAGAISPPEPALYPQPAGVPTGTPGGYGIPTLDIGTITNTALIVSNTNRIIWNTAQTANSVNSLVVKQVGSTGVPTDPTAADFIWQVIATQVLHSLTQSIVEWIDNGFQGGPSFIEDPEEFFKNTADTTIGDFILLNPDLAFLCNPFQINVRLSLGLTYSPFKDKIKCSLSGVLANSQKAYDDFIKGDFIGGGGWNSWISMTTVPTNNPSGALLATQSELEVKIGEKTLLQKNDWAQGSGFLSSKVCKDIPNPGEAGYTGTMISDEELVTYKQMNPDNKHQQKCTTETPGSIVSTMASKATGIDMDRLGLAQDLNAIMAALANAMINELVSGSKTFLSQGTQTTAQKQAQNTAWTNVGSQRVSDYSRNVYNAASRDPDAARSTLNHFGLVSNPTFIRIPRPGVSTSTTPVNITPTGLTATTTCVSSATTTMTLSWSAPGVTTFELRVSDESDGVEYSTSTSCDGKNPNDFCFNNIEASGDPMTYIVQPVINGHQYLWGVWPTAGTDGSTMATMTTTVPATCTP